MTGANVFVKDALFATLDNVSRPITLPHGKQALMIDTVGFIHKLPHELIKAFHATLEDAALADLIIVVSDASSPYLLKHLRTVEEVLTNLGAADAPQIHVLNKADLLEESSGNIMPDSLPVSALYGDGIDILLSQIEKILFVNSQSYRIFIPFSAYHLLNKLRKGGIINEETYVDDGVILQVEAEQSLMKSIAKEGIQILDDERI